MKLTRYVLIRKGIHLSASAVPLSYYLFSRQKLLCITVSLVIVALVVELLRFKNERFRARFYGILGRILWERERRTLTSATFLLISTTLSIFLFSKPVAVAAVLFLVVGDTVAYIVRDVIGKPSLFGKMCPEGLLASFLVCIPLVLLVPDLSVGVGLIGVLVSGIVETFPRVDDNLTIPLIAGVVMESLIRAFPNVV
jgi:dolichol kinase